MKIRRLLLLPILALLGALPARALTWTLTTVDGTGGTGVSNSLALQSNGLPSIAYTDSSANDLKYATFDGATWALSTVDSAGIVGLTPSLAINSLDAPAISYLDASNGDLKYAAFNGATWTISIVDSAGFVGSYSSLAFQSGNLPAISYWDVTSNDLKYAAFNGTTWIITTVDGVGNVGQFSSLAFDSAGHPCIAYYDSSNHALKYATFNGSAWIKTTVSSVTIASRLSLVIDSADHPAIAYQDNGNGYLKYAAFDGTNWAISTVAIDCNNATSLALTSAGLPRIAYQSNSLNLKYASFDGSAWTTSIVDGSGAVGGAVSLKLNASDIPSISYYDQTANDLKYATLAERPVPPAVNGVTVSVAPGKRSATFTVTNTGDATTTIRLSASNRITNSFNGPQPSKPTRNDNILTYTRGGVNITRDLLAGNVTVTLARGASTEIAVKASTRRPLKFKRTLHATLTATTQSSPAKSASAEAILTLASARN